MNQPCHTLAEMPGFGRIYDCGNCGNIHVTIGPVSVTLEPQAYMQMVALVNTSAANFETWLESRNRQSLYADPNDLPDQA
jgi:hypothetical protein